MRPRPSDTSCPKARHRPAAHHPRTTAHAGRSAPRWPAQGTAGRNWAPRAARRCRARAAPPWRRAGSPGIHGAAPRRPPGATSRAPRPACEPVAFHRRRRTPWSPRPFSPRGSPASRRGGCDWGSRSRPRPPCPSAAWSAGPDRRCRGRARPRSLAPQRPRGALRSPTRHRPRSRCARRAVHANGNAP